MTNINRKLAFIGDHVSIAQLSPDMPQGYTDKEIFANFNYGGYQPFSDAQFICCDFYDDPLETVKLIAPDCTDIVFIRTAFYCWVEKFKKIKDEMMSIGVVLNKIRTTHPNARISMLSALPLASSYPRANDENVIPIFKEMVVKIQNYFAKEVKDNKLTQQYLKDRLSPSTFAQWNGALEELLKEKRVNLNKIQPYFFTSMLNSLRRKQGNNSSCLYLF